LDEFSLIQQFFSAAAINNGVVLGIGDDTAIIKAVEGEELLFTCDTLISGVHFPVDTDPYAIAYKALAVNLSDIAAMGGQARWFTLALSLPEADPDWLEGFSNGLFALANQFAVSLVGGDTTRGALSITISVIGTIAEGQAIRRSGAKPGDDIIVTGMPGIAALALAELQGSIKQAEADSVSSRSKLDFPQPRLLEGQFLRSYASSMIDISDGLAADLGHILQASGCGAILDTDLLLESHYTDMQLPADRIIDSILYGGDDYELLFTVPGALTPMLMKSWDLTFPALTKIGEITAGEDLKILDSSGNVIDIALHGYNHFHDRKKQ
jgi:thiamine-monophosphate kinase